MVDTVSPMSGSSNATNRVYQAGTFTIIRATMKNNDLDRNMVAQSVGSRQILLQFYFSRAIIKWVTKCNPPSLQFAAGYLYAIL